MPEPTAPPNLLQRFHAAPGKRFGVGDLTSAAGDVTSAGGDAASAVTSAASDATSVASDATSAAAGVASTVESEASKVTSLVASAVSSVLSEVKDEMEKIEDELADKLADLLGIHEWYSIHLIDLCYGNFTPKTTAPNATMAVTNCTTPFDYSKCPFCLACLHGILTCITAVINVTKMLDHDLSVGPFTLNLADLGIVQDIQSGINTISKFAEVPVVIYFFAVAFIGMSMLGSIAAVFLISRTQHDSDSLNSYNRRKFEISTKLVIMANLGLASSAVLALLIANMIMTIAGKKVVEEVAEHASQYGLNAYRGTKFLATTWAAFALMVLAAIWWVIEFIVLHASAQWDRKGPSSKTVRIVSFFGIMKMPPSEKF